MLHNYRSNRILSLELAGTNLRLGVLLGHGLLLFVHIWIITSAARGQSKPPLDPYVAAAIEDASLNALALNTADSVWAAGDRGVIWATNDGGRNWTRQESGTTVNLYGIAFRDSQSGWAVGGLPGAQTRASRGVVLRTTNGGKSWEPLAVASLPRLLGIRIVGGRLIAWGDYSAPHRTGILMSMDDGRSWTPLPSPLVHVSALGADPSGSVMAVDRIGNAFSSQLGATRSFYATSPAQPMAFIEHLGSSWLAGGAGGQLLRTVDGQSWNRVATPLSPAAQRVCSWHSLANFNDHLWVAGSPGSIILHSSNRGVTWETLATEQTLPLRALAFADDQRGWAVGPLGLILATRDGGRTWYTQRKTATKLGLLSVTARGTQVPWSALVATSWDDSVATRSITVFGHEPAESADFRVESWICRQALAPQIGLVEHQGWQIPDNPPERASQGEDFSSATLAERLAVELRTWRPDVVLTDETGDGRLQELNREVVTLVATAIESATQSAATSIATELRLPSWKVTKLAAVCDPRTAQYSEQSSRLLREPGLSIWDLLQPMSTADLDGSQKIAMRTLQHGQTTAATNSSLMGGIAPNTASRRGTIKRNLGNYQLIMGRVHRTASLDSIATLPNDVPFSEWQAQLDFVLRSLPPRELTSMLLRVADLSAAPQNWARRQFALERLAQMQPESDAATYARLKVLQMLSSDELLAWGRMQEANAAQSLANSRPGSSASLIAPIANTPSPFDTLTTADPLVTTVSATSKSSGDNAVTTASFLGEATPSNSAATIVSAPRSVAPAVLESQRFSNFFATLDACTKADPFLIDWPELSTMYQAINRGKAELQPGASPSMSALEQLRSLTSLAGWPQIAHQGLVLAAGRADQLRWVTLALAAAEPPRLDGVLDEPLWATCPPMQLTTLNADGEHGTDQATKIRWAYNSDYLFIAIDAARTVASKPSAPPRVRSYDSDLRLSDYVQLMLDTDRDYASAVELGVSADGETYDRVCGIPGYNPKWFVAVPQVPNPQRWTAEIAIRLTDLTTHPDLAGRAWAVTALRRSPTGQDQSWSLLKTNEACLQSAGLMLFVPPLPRD
jgi:photosystem II stability/assembly factor-like uncharacterized protein